MNRFVLAEFTDVATLRAAAARLRDEGVRISDAFTPFPVPDLAAALDPAPLRIRLPMLVAGAALAAGAYFMEWYSAVLAYPYDAGGRPLHSWPAFLLVPFEIGIFAAALAGLIAFLRCAALPRLHHPLFAMPGIERASQDRFFLLVATDADVAALRRRCEDGGAVAATELRP